MSEPRWPLEDVCKFYADWYDGKEHRGMDGGTVAYEMVSMIRQIIAERAAASSRGRTPHSDCTIGNPCADCRRFIEAGSSPAAAGAVERTSGRLGAVGHREREDTDRSETQASNPAHSPSEPPRCPTCRGLRNEHRHVNGCCCDDPFHGRDGETR